MAHKNVNLIWREPLMGDLRLIELFLCCDICGWDGIVCVGGGQVKSTLLRFSLMLRRRSGGQQYIAGYIRL